MSQLAQRSRQQREDQNGNKFSKKDNDSDLIEGQHTFYEVIEDQQAKKKQQLDELPRTIINMSEQKSQMKWITFERHHLGKYYPKYAIRFNTDIKLIDQLLKILFNEQGHYYEFRIISPNTMKWEQNSFDYLCETFHDVSTIEVIVEDQFQSLNI